MPQQLDDGPPWSDVMPARIRSNTLILGQTVLLAYRKLCFEHIKEMGVSSLNY